MSLNELLARRPNPVQVARGLSAPPAEQLAIITCMDARIAAFDVFGLRVGDAHIIRNAGAAVTSDVIRSLAVSQRKLGTKYVFLVAHTGCGMLSFTDDEFVNELADETGQPPTWRPGTFTDPARHVRHGMAQLRTSPFLTADMDVRGFVFDLRSGAVDEIETQPGEPAGAPRRGGFTTA